MVAVSSAISTVHSDMSIRAGRERDLGPDYYFNTMADELLALA